MVELKPGFVSGFGDGIRIPFGLPQEIKSGGLDFVRLSEINLSRFRLPADRQKFQADFEYAIEVDLGPAYARMDYHFFWNPQTHRTAIIELGLDASTVVKFPAGHVGSHWHKHIAETTHGSGWRFGQRRGSWDHGIEQWQCQGDASSSKKSSTRQSFPGQIHRDLFMRKGTLLTIPSITVENR